MIALLTSIGFRVKSNEVTPIKASKSEGKFISNKKDVSPPVFYRGADLSFSSQLESLNVPFYDKGVKMTSLKIFKNHGCNLVRLRLWHGAAAQNNIKDVIAYSKRVKQAGMSLLLDIYYSDTWADVSKQPAPVAWKGLQRSALLDSVYNYTYSTIQQFKANGVMPDIVQIGNEINYGMLWDISGKLKGTSDPGFKDLDEILKKAIAGLYAADTQHHAKTLIQYANLKGADKFFQNLQNDKVPFDIIGVSYYPFAPTNDLNDLTKQLSALATGFNADILVVETSFPFTKARKESKGANALGDNFVQVPGIPVSPQGQKQYLLELRKAIKKIPNNHGIGFCYWAPDWVAYDGPPYPYVSAWDNQTLFDFHNNALPGLDAFKP